MGNPLTNKLGLYQSGEYYIGEFENILSKNSETLTLILTGIYVFMGLYHLFVYLLQKKIKYNLYYGLFSVVVGAYIISRTAFINTIIPNSTVSTRLEYFFCYLCVPFCAMFIESFTIGKLWRITRVYSAVFIVFAVFQFFIPNQCVEILLNLWQAACLPVFFVFLWCDIYYPMKKTLQNSNAKTLRGFFSVIVESYTGNLFAGIVITAFTAIFDIVDSFLFHYEFFTVRYGIAVLTCGIAMILARRLDFLYKKQERVIERSNKGMNPALVDWIVVQDRDPIELPSKNEKTAVMFTDIRNFTKLSETMPSQDVTGILMAFNELLVRTLFALQDSGRDAYTDKFIGDAMMNIFGSGEDAVNTAVKFRKQTAIFNANPRLYYKNAPPNLIVDIGCGIAWGNVTFGVMGHSRRLDYTPVGDTVNLASRIENLTRIYNIPILFNDTLYNSMLKKHEYIRHIDTIRVKGRNEVVTIYEDFSADHPYLRKLKLSMQKTYEKLRGFYVPGKDWDAAYSIAEKINTDYLEIVKNLDDTVKIHADHLPYIYLERIQMILKDKTLRDNWDGVWNFTEK